MEMLIIKRYDNNDDLLTPDGRRLNENETSWCGLYSKVSRAKCKSMERLDNCNPEIRIADTWPPRITAKGSFMAIISFRVWKCFVYTTSEKTNTPAPKQENTTSTSEPITIIIIVLGISLGISVVVIVLLIRKFIQDTVENPPTINNNPAAMNENEYETESPENGHEFRSQQTDAIYSTAHNFSTNDQLPIYASANDPVSSSEMVNNVLYQQYRARETN
ncbi:unnamed protein product [Clavelina lepadiformis]|uniref:Uncharacterized protein n=1 Tax=Clavelina lepadiformis TaxID=159417 RepID=A0ABP0FLJ9_CLALP